MERTYIRLGLWGGGLAAFSHGMWRFAEAPSDNAAFEVMGGVSLLVLWLVLEMIWKARDRFLERSHENKGGLGI